MGAGDRQQLVLQWPVDGALKMCHSVAIITVKRSLFKTLKRAEGAAKKKVQSAAAGIAVAVGYYTPPASVAPAPPTPPGSLLLPLLLQLLLLLPRCPADCGDL